jgi:hypothetical protein
MWAPRSWEEIDALIGTAGATATVDFERGLPGTPIELANDVAAMTVNGGLLIYGIQKDEATGLANAVIPLEIEGTEERVRQVVGSLIRPAPPLEDLLLLSSPEDPLRGVLILVIPLSNLAPHQVDGYYPCRHGTTTARLEEAEIERLYRQRRESSGRPISTQGHPAVKLRTRCWRRIRRAAKHVRGPWAVIFGALVTAAAGLLTPWVRDRLFPPTTGVSLRQICLQAGLTGTQYIENFSHGLPLTHIMFPDHLGLVVGVDTQFQGFDGQILEVSGTVLDLVHGSWDPPHTEGATGVGYYRPVHPGANTTLRAPQFWVPLPTKPGRYVVRADVWNNGFVNRLASKEGPPFTITKTGGLRVTRLCTKS